MTTDYIFTGLNGWLRRTINTEAKQYTIISSDSSAGAVSGPCKGTRFYCLQSVLTKSEANWVLLNGYRACKFRSVRVGHSSMCDTYGIWMCWAILPIHHSIHGVVHDLAKEKFSCLFNFITKSFVCRQEDILLSNYNHTLVVTPIRMTTDNDLYQLSKV